MAHRIALKNLFTTALSAALLFVWCGAPLAQVGQDAEAAAFAAQVQASMLALEDGDRDAPRDHWDPQYVVDTVGIEPAALYAWTRENVTFMPYQGLLRGAEGVLMDRVGNSLDQSVLLATLLTDAGYEVRLARATLSADKVDAVWAALAAARQPPIEEDPQVENASVVATAEQYGIDSATVGDVIDVTNDQAVGILSDLGMQVTDQTARLSEIVGPMQTAELAAQTVADARLAIADHWWVEYQDNGVWTSLDLMPDAAVTAAATLDPAALPAGLEHQVTIRVVTEQLKDGALTNTVILEQVVTPRQLLGTTLGFRHFPMAWPEDWPQMTPDDVQIKLRSALYAQSEWMPVLVLGDAVFGTQGVFDTGAMDPNPRPVNPFMQMSVAMIGVVSKATDTLATGGDPDALLPADPTLDVPYPPRPEGELVAEWLEYEITVPGHAPRKTTREVFDLLGPAARAKGDFSAFAMTRQMALDRAMAMMGESQIQILSSKLAPDFLLHLGAVSALDNRPVLDELASDPFGKLPSNYMELFSKLKGLPSALYNLATLRFAANPFSDWIYIDRPTIVAQHTSLHRAGGGDFVAKVSLDIVENGMGVDPFAADHAALLRVSQGVADTNAEAQALSDVGPVLPNTAQVFSAAQPAGSGWIALRAGDEALLVKLGRDPDTVARISADLAQGLTVVLPAHPTAEQTAAGWWRIDPDTGNTLGIGPSGHGQAMVEYALIIIIETMMAAAQCALEASLTKALEKTLQEKARGAGSGQATGAGLKAGYAQAAKDLGNTGNRNRCIAMGLFAGFKGLLLGFAMHAVRTSGNKGYDGSKPGNSFETNSVRNARNASNAAPGRPGAPARSGTPTIPGVAPQAGGPRGSNTPTQPGLGPGAKGAPTNAESAGTKPAPRTPTPDEAADTRRAPKTPSADEAAQTERVPGQSSPRDRLLNAQERAAKAQQDLANHTPIDTPQGRAETDQLWKDLDKANRKRIEAWDDLPNNQRPIAPPSLPDVPRVERTGPPPPSQRTTQDAPAQPAPGSGKQDPALADTQPQSAAPMGTKGQTAPLPRPPRTGTAPMPGVTPAQATRASGMAGLAGALQPISGQ